MASLTDSERAHLGELDEEACKRLLREAEDLANTSRRQLYILVSAGFFLMLTLSVPDSQLVRADAEISWPLIQTEVQLTTFLSYAPLALVALAIYLHLFLERLIELRRRGFPAPETYVFVMSNLPARIVADFLLYIYVPVILAWFSWKVVFRQEAPYLIGATLTVALLSALLYYFRAVHDGSEPRRRIGLGALGLTSVVALLALTLVAIWGTEPILWLRRVDLARADIGVTEEFERVNLAESALNHADMRFARLSGADLRGADLGGANMNYARIGGGPIENDPPHTVLENASLVGATMLGADLRSASFACATLRDTDLSQAILGDTIFRGADLRGADLTRTTAPQGDLIFQAATMTGVKMNFAEWDLPNFNHARLEGAEMDGVVFPGASFAFADLRDAVIHNASLEGASFVGADLTGADLSYALLTRAKFSGANLTGADLTGADLTGAAPIGPEPTGEETAGPEEGTEGAERMFAGALLCRTTFVDGRLRDNHCGRIWEDRQREAPCHRAAALGSAE